MLFPGGKKLIFTSPNERFAENYVPVEEKIAFTGNSSLLFKKMEENGIR